MSTPSIIITPITPPRSKPDVVIPDSKIVKSYSEVTGYDPLTGLNDKGAACLYVLNYWRKNGVADHKIYAFAKLNPKNIKHIKLAIYMFGGIYIGFDLPLSCQKQEIWDVPASGANGDGLKGSWGGHAVCAIGYDSQYVYIISWGVVKKVTWNFFTTYCDEAYAIISKDFVGTKTPHGFDFDTLQKDLKAITA